MESMSEKKQSNKLEDLIDSKFNGKKYLLFSGFVENHCSVKINRRIKMGGGGKFRLSGQDIPPPHLNPAITVLFLL